MSRMINFIHYGKVKAKERPRFNGKFVYTPKGTLKSEQGIAKSFIKQYPDFRPLTGYLSADIIIGYRPAKDTTKKELNRLLDEIYCDKGGDADNIIKSVFDSLNGVAYVDDKQIVKFSVVKIYSAEHYVEIVINKA
jgi:Holliday junction resolvase RusA-like endonuclease